MLGDYYYYSPAYNYSSKNGDVMLHLSMSKALKIHIVSHLTLLTFLIPDIEIERYFFIREVIYFWNELIIPKIIP